MNALEGLAVVRLRPAIVSVLDYDTRFGESDLIDLRNQNPPPQGSGQSASTTRAVLVLSATGGLAPGGSLLIGMGLYFVFLRPTLLPEDARYMRATVGRLQEALPGLSPWLRRVFGVPGGFMFATRLLTVHIAMTTFRAGRPGAVTLVALLGLASIGWMAGTNFAIDPDFKWLLLAFPLPWVAALALSWAGQRRMDPPA